MTLLLTVFLLGFGASIGYWLLPDRYRGYVLPLVTFLFLLYQDWVSCLLLSIITISGYGIIHQIADRKTGLLLSIALPVTAVVFYKLQYLENFAEFNLIIPLGLSYYTFRQIHYGFEHYKGTLVSHRFLSYLEYMFFLPTILVGPIHRFNEFFMDQTRRRWDPRLFALGLERILYGWVKIVVLSNDVINLRLKFWIEWLADQGRIWESTYLEILQYVANTYFQFSGYSDIAIGLALLFGYRIIENFNFPFLATNISDFWKRWHISLSSWCRDYVFNPVLAKSRLALPAIVSSMLVLALWHEISLRYVLWGSMHAVGLFCWYLYKQTRLAQYLGRFLLNRVLGILITGHFVLLSFVIVKEDTLSEALSVLRILLKF